jgi:hypothetical protein
MIYNFNFKKIKTNKEGNRKEKKKERENHGTEEYQ